MKPRPSKLKPLTLKSQWDHMELLRIYTKPKGQIPDYNEPVVMPKERLGPCSVELFCNR